MGVVKKEKLMSKLLGIGIIFMLLFSSSTSAFAKGVNLNDPAWKIYDDCFLNYSGIWLTYAGGCETTEYDGYHYTQASNCKVEFDFMGSKLRIISERHYEKCSSNILIKIDDNIVERFSGSEMKNYGVDNLRVVYEKLNLTNEKHHVQIITQDSNYFNISAIAVDKNGALVSNPKVRPLLSKNPIKENDVFTTDIILDDGINVCAEDLMLSYDKDLFEYIGYEKIDGIKQCRVGVDRNLGKVRCLISHNKINDSYKERNKNIIRLKFLAKKDGRGKISVISGITKDSSGIKNNILNDNCKNVEVSVNKSDDGGLGDLGDLGNLDDF
ncbi:cohesin domain-containing protein [Clostridium oceanicum]|uniref:Uncharacterized protein n=1 Tax=Clostridium oceanicum TaxID=1543 RepID=A0ABP3UMA8_9CLOT